MSSSPSSTRPRSPKRTSPKRTPLQERSQSQTNEVSSRLSKDARSDQENLSIYSTTPFPTKAAHVLLPSSIKTHKIETSPLTGPSIGSTDSKTGKRKGKDAAKNAQGAPPRSTVKLKRSVKALRDLYEAQAEEASRPSTATSAGRRPSTAGSGRLRSLSSSESLSGAFAWEAFRKVSADDLATLPTLPQGGLAARRMPSQPSFASLVDKFGVASSPNYRVVATTSSPRQPGFPDHAHLGQPLEAPSSPQNTSSSPNVIRLGNSSSPAQLRSAQGASSPNFVKLGTSSPAVRRSKPDVYFSHSRSSSTSSRKRKRSDADERPSPFAARRGAKNPLASSPPVDRYAPTSPCLPRDQGHAASALQTQQFTQSSSSLAEANASLQSVLSSSPPRIQYPIVRAPPLSQHAGLVVPKRVTRTASAEAESPPYNARPSGVPTEGSWMRPRRPSVDSSLPDDLDDYLHSDELAPASAYILSQRDTQSQIRIVRDTESLESHEASDEVSALPSSEYVYRPPVFRSSFSNSFITSPASSQSRLNSLRSFTQPRNHHFAASSLRPTSAGSVASNVMFPVPNWARRYYSGVYRESFHYLYASASQVNLQNPRPMGYGPVSTLRNVHTKSRPDTSKSEYSPSMKNVHQSMTERLEAFFKAKSRPRLEARKSHTLVGVGPLVSNPVREPESAILASVSRPQSFVPARPGSNLTRIVSGPLSPADPRAHWAGIAEVQEQTNDGARGNSTLRHAPSFAYSISRPGSRDPSVIYHPGGRRPRFWDSSPHLHHDNRLNTGSTASRGFGFPFNAKAHWTGPPSVMHELESGEGLVNLRKLQVVFFASGFLLPLTWFVAAFLPLPKRPAPMADLEKAVHAETVRTQSHPYSLPPHSVTEQDKLDMVAKLQHERQIAGAAELRWQNARWWRNLNRWMCSVGVVACVVVIVLAILGTKGNW